VTFVIPVLAKDRTVHYDVSLIYLKLITYKIQCRTIYPGLRKILRSCAAILLFGGRTPGL
jgi:hypothetical protein